MAKTFDNSAGFIFDSDYGYFDGPDPDLIDVIGQGIASAEGFGVAEVTLHIQNLTGIASGEQFGIPEVTLQLYSYGIASLGVVVAPTILSQWQAGVGPGSTNWEQGAAGSTEWAAVAAKDTTWVPGTEGNTDWTVASQGATDWVKGN